MSRTALRTIQAAAGNAGGDFYPYTVDNSVRLDGSSKLSRTVSSGSGNTKCTFSCWLKISDNSGTNGGTVVAGADGYNQFQSFNQTLYFGDASVALNTYALFRDVSAWYNFVMIVDTTLATASDRAQLWVNGVRQSLGNTYNVQPTQNSNFNFYNTAQTWYLGGRATDHYCKGYMAEVAFVDGTAYSATDFGQSKNGVWVPKNVSGLTYGTNGFYLDFADSSALGNDVSGNNNDFTSSGLTSSDQMIDTPTNSFATLNSTYPEPVSPSPSDTYPAVYSEGNLKAVHPLNGRGVVSSTLATPASGKYYFEVRITGSATTYFVVGGMKSAGVGEAKIPGSSMSASNFYWYSEGYVYVNGVDQSAGIASYVSGDIIGFEFDTDNSVVSFYKNGTLDSYTLSIDCSDMVPIAFDGTGSVNFQWTTHWNFGQNGTFNGNVTAGGNSDANGIGDFKYTVPTDALAICTANLPEPTIGPNSSTQSDENFNTVLYTGTGSARTVTGVGFQPDWLWIKKRSAAENHALYDVLRGPTKRLESNNTNVEDNESGGVSSFDSDGFSIQGASDRSNTSGATYVAWNWKANGSGSSNTDGSITSTVSANQDAGFSIVGYTGNGTDGATVGHGLGITPDAIILKNRDDGTYNWRVYHSSLTSGHILGLDSSAASVLGSSGNAGYISAVSSSTFTLTQSGAAGLAAVNENSEDIVAYCFAEVEGFSKFGSYTGNGSSTDGPFIYTGFRPAWIMVKRTDTTGNWLIIDTARDTYNVGTKYVYADSSDSEQSNGAWDYLSNGFKIRNTYANDNASGGSYIFMAFSEMPFRYSNAR